MTKTTEATVPTSNVLTFRKPHPKDRASFGIVGVAGIAVFDLRLFASGKAPKFITLDCALAVGKVAPAKTSGKGKKS